MNRLRAVSWNTKVGRRPARVAAKIKRIARRHRVDVFLLQEAGGYVETLRHLPGWQILAPIGHGEARGCPILVRDGLDARKLRAIRCQNTWTGPKAGKHHRGRVYTVADIEGVRFINVHRTRPGWSRGGQAFAEEHDRLLEAARNTDGPLVIVGDQNIGTRPGRDRASHTPWALAHTIDARIIGTTPGRIDYAIARGVTGKARELGKYGSDHRAVLFDLVVR